MTEAVPLTAAEGAIWLASLMSASKVAYNAGCILTIEGPVDDARLAWAGARALIDAGLSSAEVKLREGKPVWSRSLAANATSCVISETAHSEVAAGALRDRFKGAPLRPDAWPLVGIEIVKVSAERRLVLFRHHHVLMDYVANGMLMRNMAALYDGAPVPPCAPRAEIFAADQAYRASPAYGEDWRYWRDRLGGVAPGALSPPGELSDDVRRVDVTVAPPAFAKFADAVRRVGATPFQALLLSLHSFFCPAEGEEIVFGIPFANRRGGAADALASLSCIVPFRVRFERKATFGERLERLRFLVKADLAHGRFPIWENAARLFPGAARGALPGVALNYMRSATFAFGQARARITDVLYGEKNARTYVRCIEREDRLIVSVEGPNRAEALAESLREAIGALPTQLSPNGAWLLDSRRR